MSSVDARYFVGLVGWILVTCGVMGLILPFVPTGEANSDDGTSIELVAGCLAAIAGGILIVLKARSRAS